MMNNSIVIIHINNHLVQAGFTGDSEPRVEFPPIIDGKKPILAQGCVTDWDGWLQIVTQAYSELGVTSKGSSLLLTEPFQIQKKDREKMTQLAFDRLGVDAFNLTNDAMLVLIANGCSTGTVVYSDRDITYVVPIQEGFIMPKAAIVPPISSDDLDKNPEVLFDPTLVGSSSGPSAPIHRTTYESIMKCDESCRSDLLNRIVLAGKFTKFPEMSKRMKDEMTKLVSSKYKVKVVAPESRHNSVFIGGSLITTFKYFSAFMISREDYMIHGATFVHRRCC